ncbi:MAG: hypothetical protein ACRD5L_05780, partial [Bryobacteraceae bacterium]
MISMLRIAAVSLAVAALGAGADFTENFRSSQPLRSGGTLTVKNVNGPVEITAWDRESVDIDAVKQADSRDLLNSVRIEVQTTGDGVSIRTIVPEHHHGSAG